MRERFLKLIKRKRRNSGWNKRRGAKVFEGKGWKSKCEGNR